jgi:hypothetical protein
MKNNDPEKYDQKSDGRKADPEGMRSPHAKDHKQRGKESDAGANPSGSDPMTIWRRVCNPENSTGITAVSTFAVAVFAGVIAVATAYNVWVANRQWRVAREAADVARDSLVSVQRAYVTFLNDMKVQGDISDPKAMKVVLWEFSVQVENSGTTPTRDAIIDAAIHTSENDLPDDFGYPDSPGPHQLIVLGPKARAGTNTVTATPETMKAVQDKKTRLFIYGYCSYKDIFQSAQDPHRVTKFCFELKTFGGDPFSALGPHNAFWATCPHHNCTDEDCSEEPHPSPP